MTATEFYNLVLNNHHLVDFKGHDCEADNILRHCNTSDCESCIFSSLDKCLLYSYHNPHLLSTLERIQSTHPELFI